MSRRHRAVKREILPDAKFGDVVITRFMNALMYDGKKSAAEGIVYGALDVLKKRGGPADPVRMFHEALDNVKPAVEVRSRRVGGATYQVPVEVRTERARRWRSAGSSMPPASAASTRWKTGSRTSCWTR
jgi:small subunit ribosomal protein S7